MGNLGRARTTHSFGCPNSTGNICGAGGPWGGCSDQPNRTHGITALMHRGGALGLQSKKQLPLQMRKACGGRRALHQADERRLRGSRGRFHTLVYLSSHLVVGYSQVICVGAYHWNWPASAGAGEPRVASLICCMQIWSFFSCVYNVRRETTMDPVSLAQWWEPRGLQLIFTMVSCVPSRKWVIEGISDEIRVHVNGSFVYKLEADAQRRRTQFNLNLYGPSRRHLFNSRRRGWFMCVWHFISTLGQGISAGL